MKVRLRGPSDWLSPVLVKEMRQGLKSKAFVGFFLVMHAAMVASIAFALAAESPLRMRQTSGGLFWGVTVISLLGLVPALGLNAVASELKGRTFELMILTRLTAWRVVVGKWASIVAQGGLVVSSLLPYLVARYFLGAVNLVLELVALTVLLFIGGALVALSVYVSTFDKSLTRILMLLAQGIVLVSGLVSITPLLGSGSSMAGVRSSVGFGAVVAVGLSVVILVAFVLQAAATRLAPPAENHAAPKRGLALGLLILGALPMTRGTREGVMVALVTALLLVCLEAVSERISGTPSTYRPFARWPGPLAMFGAWLYPGWPSALLFTAGVAAGLGALLVAGDVAAPAQGVIAALAFGATIALPLALARLPRKLAAVGGLALALHLILLMVATIGTEASAFLGLFESRETLPAVFPASALAFAGAGELPSELYATSAIAMALWLGLAGLLLMWRGRGDLGVVFTAQRLARRPRGPE